MWMVLYGFYSGFIFCKGWLITLWILCNYLYNYFIQYIIICKIFIVTDNKIQYTPDNNNKFNYLYIIDLLIKTT